MQMEKRSLLEGEHQGCQLRRAQRVLQRGLTRNPYSASLCQVLPWPLSQQVILQQFTINQFMLNAFCNLW